MQEAVDDGCREMRGADSQQSGPWREQERNEKRNCEDHGENASHERSREAPLGEVSGREKQEARGQVPRVRRDDRGEEQAVEEKSAEGPDAAGHSREDDEKRQFHRVRMQIAEPVREERPLGDGFPRLFSHLHDVLDAAGRLPEEIEVLERLRPEELAHAIHRSAGHEENRARGGQRPSAAAGPDHAEGREGEQRRQERRDEVVRVLRSDARGAQRESEKVRAEVVVGESRSGHPGIHHWDVRRHHEARQDGEVHGLLGETHLDRPAQPEEEEEEAGENAGRQERPPPRRRLELLKRAGEEGDRDDERDEGERQRHASDGDAEEPGEEPARYRGEDEPDRDREGDGGVEPDLRVGLAREKPGEERRSAQAGEDERQEKENRRKQRHGAR